MGGPDRSPAESVDALEEAIEVIRLMWSGERSVSFEGRHYRLEDARPGPAPVHPMGIWLGAFRPRMIRLVGRKADGWVPSLGVLSAEELKAGNERIDAAADAAGRDPRADPARAQPPGGDRREPDAARRKAAGRLPARGSRSPARPSGGPRRSPASPRTASTRSCSGPSTHRPSRWSCSRARSCRCCPTTTRRRSR